MIKRIALTTGEPAGIGPELLVQLAHQTFDGEFVVIGDPGLLSDRAAMLGMSIELVEFDQHHAAVPHIPGRLKIVPIRLARASQCGHLDVENAPYVIRLLEVACRGCVDETFHAMVTGPIHKGLINRSGTIFTGHTEYLAQQTGCEQAVMMLSTPELRVALVTTHVPITEISGLITATRLTKVIHILNRDLRQWFGIPRPRITVCGLNPHAGEGGHLGREECETITPTLDKLRAQGLDLTGPLPADTAFTPHVLNDTDCVLAMYHDQGLPVLKHLSFGQAVNITLGLPIIRTSVDHGTALELAGTGQADLGSLDHAVDTAIQMARKKDLSPTQAPTPSM